MNRALKELAPGGGKIYISSVRHSVRERTSQGAEKHMIYLTLGCKSDVAGHTGSGYPPSAPQQKEHI